MPCKRTRVYRDELTARVSIKQLRQAFGPAWRGVARVQLAAPDGTTFDVTILQLPCKTAFGGTKRHLLCACGRAVTALGYAAELGWTCAECGHWVGRDRNRLLRSPSRKLTACVAQSHAPSAPLQRLGKDSKTKGRPPLDTPTRPNAASRDVEGSKISPTERLSKTPA